MVESVSDQVIMQHFSIVKAAISTKGILKGGISISDSDDRMLILAHIAPATPKYTPEELNDFVASTLQGPFLDSDTYLSPSHTYPNPPEKPQVMMIAKLYFNPYLPADPEYTTQDSLVLPWEMIRHVETTICIYPHIKFAESIAKRQQQLITGTARRSDLNNGWIQLSDIERVKQGLEPLDVEIPEKDTIKRGFRFW
jgi:hypothetical protein